MFGTESLSANPFAAPASQHHVVSLGPELKRAEAVRQLYLEHEGRLRLAGNIYLFIAMLCFSASPAILIRSGWAMSAIIALFFAAVFALFGQSLRQLQRPMVPFLTAFCSTGLLLPFGLMIVNAGIEPDLPYVPVELALNTYILYLVHSHNGRYLFTPDYEAIRRATPHIQPRMSAGAQLLYLVLALLTIATTIGMLRVTLGHFSS